MEALLFSLHEKPFRNKINNMIKSKVMFSNKQLFRLIFPLLVEQLLVMLVGMADTIMVSAAGEAAISGVSVVNDVNNLIIAILTAVAGGGAVIVTQYLGNQDSENTKLSASQLIMISFLISLIFGVLCVSFHSQILHVLYGSVEAYITVLQLYIEA